MAVTYASVLTALYDYNPDGADDEVAIKEDQILLLLDGSDDEWWKVKIKTNSQEDNGASGLVPKAYVEEAKPITSAKALYDYTANGDGELSISEDEPLYVYEQEEEWSLVKSNKPGGKAGYVPATYIELSGAVQNEQEEDDAVAAASVSTPAAEPRSSYSDPSELVAASHTKARDDPIQTWSVSILDEKDKKKKGTLGVGNGAIFFASESDKAAVQQWPTSSVVTVTSDKAKHVDIQIATGSEIATRRFVASSKSIGEEIMAKVQSSKNATSGPSTPAGAHTPDPINTEAAKHHKNGASVRFAMSPDSVIPDKEEEEEEEDGERASALYDFTAQASDELSVKEGEALVVINRVESEEWWKCRNAKGEEGVVPSSYVELKAGGAPAPRASQDDEDTATEIAAAKAAEQQAAAMAERKRMEQVRQREEAERISAEEKRRKREQDRADAEAKRKEIEKLEYERAKARSIIRGSADSEPRKSNADKPRPNKTRVWHDRTGQFKVEAEFLGIENGKIKLHKTNGVIIDVPSAKMSPEDMAYIEKLIDSGKRPATAPDEDNVPLSVIAERRNSRPPSQPPSQPPRPTSQPQPQPKKPQVDWFDFFLNAGCDLDDCTRYAAAFNRDKIDEAIVGDIKESTLRSLGLREGDIIRVMKAIEKRGWRHEDDSARKEQMRKDEELARQLQAQENAGSPRRSSTTSPAPNLFTGPGGALKNQTRRGRPPPSSKTAPVAVDVNALQTSSRGGTPRVSSPPGGVLTSSPTERPASAAAAPTPAAPARVMSGFDDDAWTPRPSSTKPTSPAPAVALSPPPVVATPPAPVAPTPPPPPPAPPAPAPAPAVAPVAAPTPLSTTAPAIQRPATTTSATSQPASSEFDILAKIGQMKLEQQQRPPSAPVVSQPTGAGIQAPASFQSGLGMGNSPVPVGQLLTAQQTGMFGNLGPRGPPAPIPANQSLLSPLIPTNSGFNAFVPTRPGSTPTFGGLQAQPTGFQPSQPSFLQSQPTGFQPSQPSFLSSQPTGFQPSQPSFLQSQPTGFQPSPQPNFMQPQQTGFVPSPMASQSPPIGFQPTGMGGMFNGGSLQPPTGFQPGFQPQQQQNMFSAPPSNAPPQNNLSAANVFASMKAGTFAGNNPAGPQSADKYDALRQPNGQGNFMQPQQTGFGYQPQQQFQPGFGGY
ncbi:actin cytoskeleton-regulatory complex protein SLA1 [Ceratobasidium sp. AG-Ba]|nr:actin cytoskeleton-regulatory complex protein SLA1 [Ceratobasidium sp. AG-Ba]QRW05278.1 actin cytoskeleton-regulatory complex protein SLA1 [Ceratobasidium sp. AG-Ba]